jgi:type IV pilus assembly protein PilW
MSKQTVRSKRHQAGFSIVEIMIAVAIGMIAMVTVMQIFGASEAKKRITTGGNDAQMGGVLALTTLQRDVQQAGLGLTTMQVLGCNLTLRAGVTLNGLAPVTINHPSIPGGDSNTDTLLVVYGASNGAPEGIRIVTQPDTKVYAVATPPAFSKDDWVIAAPVARPATCVLALDKVTTAAATTTVLTGGDGMAGGALYNLGHDTNDSARGPQFLAYAVRKGNLTVCDFMVNNCADAAAAQKADTAIWTPIASNIVSLRAQYGRNAANAMDAGIDIYDQTFPVSTDKAYACKIARISAVRLALVARTGDFDKTAPTKDAPVWEGSVADNPKGSAAAPINLEDTEKKNQPLPEGATWQNYRYRVFQTVVPIRATMWLEPQKGC